MKQVCCAIVLGLIWPALVMAGPQVLVTLLDGATQSGELAGLDSEHVKLETAEGLQQIQIGNVLLVETKQESVPVEDEKSLLVTGGDQSQLRAISFLSDGTTATIESASLGKLSLPVRQLADVRLAPLDGKIDASWQDLRTRNSRDDLLIIRKGEVLDYVAGSVGEITAEKVTMLVRGKELAAPRDRIFGIVFASQTAVPAARRVGLRTSAGDLVQAERIEMSGEIVKVFSTSLGMLELSLSQVAMIDLGGGRIRLLADLPVDASGSKSPNLNEPVIWFMSKNSPAGSGGKGVMRIGQKDYKRGLWLHSGAVMRYRLNREYTRLRATAGFELTYVTRMPRFEPKVRLLITGDGRELLKQEFSWNDPPAPIDVDLTDVRELTIQVESLGARQGILEHFGLGDAQVIQ